MHDLCMHTMLTCNTSANSRSYMERRNALKMQHGLDGNREYSLSHTHISPEFMSVVLGFLQNTFADIALSHLPQAPISYSKSLDHIGRVYMHLRVLHNCTNEVHSVPLVDHHS